MNALPRIHSPADSDIIGAAEVWAAAKMQGLEGLKEAERQLMQHVARRQRALKAGEGTTACPACGKGQ